MSRQDKKTQRMFDSITKSILAQGNGLKRDPETGVLYEEPLKEEHPVGNLLLLRGSGPALAKGLQWIGEKAMPSVLLKGIGQTFPKLAKVTTAVSPYADAGAMATWGAAGLEAGKQGIKEEDAVKAIAGYTMAAMPVIGVNPEMPVNKANKVARALNKEVKSTEIVDSPVVQNILAGKLGWAPKQSKVIWHNSESPISKLDHTFPAWDIVKRDAPLGHVWGTGTETKQGFIGARPFHLRSAQPVEMNKPMIQLNESVGNGKNAVRNEILRYADQSGADAINFSNISDNTLSNQDVYAVFKDVTLGKSGEIPIFTKSPIVKSIYAKPAANFTSVSTKDAFMSNPEYLTKDHVPFSIEVPKPNYTEGYRIQTIVPQKQKGAETNFQKFLNKSNSEKDEIVRYWYGEKYSSFKELEQNSKDFNSFKRYINGIKTNTAFELPSFGGVKMNVEDPAERNFLVNLYKTRYPTFRPVVNPTKIDTHGLEYMVVGMNPMTEDLAIHKDLIRSRLDKLSSSWRKQNGLFMDPTTHSPRIRKGEDILDQVGEKGITVVLPIDKTANTGGFYSLTGRYAGNGYAIGNPFRKKPLHYTQLHETISHPADLFISNVESDVSKKSIKDLYTRVTQPTDLFPNFSSFYKNADSKNWVEGRATNNEMVKRINEIVSKNSGKTLREVYENPKLLEEYVNTKLANDSELVKFLNSVDSAYLKDYATLLEKNINTINGHIYANRIRSMIKILPAIAGVGVVTKSLQNEKQGGILKAQRGAFEDFWNTLPQNQQDSTDFNVRRYWELNGKPINFKEAVKRGMYKKEKDGYHANSIAFNEETGEYEFMKSPNHPTIQYELDWFNSNKAKNFRSKYQLDSTSIPWKYVPKRK